MKGHCMREFKKNMGRFALCLAMLLLSWSCAAAQENLRPELSDPIDRAVQQLCVMSQRDEAFEGLNYNGGLMIYRGCQPVSLTNALVASMGVTDKQEASEMVIELTHLLVSQKNRKKGRIELERLDELLSQEARLQQAEAYPQLAKVIGGYEGEITLIADALDAQTVGDYFAQHPQDMLVGRLNVYPDWTAMLEIAQRLHEMGLDDAWVSLANVSAGRKNSGTPLGSGESGHYLTLMLHVGSFVQEGRIYVLDSLPRALEGEESGRAFVLRSPYPFTQKRGGFKKLFDAGRISETVIRLTPKDTQAWQSAPIEAREEMLEPLVLYGLGILMITVN